MIRPTSVTVCMATWRRPSAVDALRSIDAQQGLEGVTVDIIVADNDETPSARELIETAARDLRTPVTYVHAPARNISIARNATLDAARGEWAAFIDDDETAAPDWLAKLLTTAQSSGASLVIGPAFAVYPPDAPDWMKEQDHHSNLPVTRGGQAQTGHTCNALVRIADPAIRGERFRLDKGRSGGEDTEFFFRLWKKGRKIEIASDAKVYETVDPARLNYDWIAKRKFRAGQSYGFHSLRTGSGQERLKLRVAAASKVVFSLTLAALCFTSPGRRRFWSLRGRMHQGVMAATFGRREEELYGTSPHTEPSGPKSPAGP